MQVEDSARTQSWIELVPALLGYDISKSLMRQLNYLLKKRPNYHNEFPALQAAQNLKEASLDLQ